jgi:hypothetical protein
MYLIPIDSKKDNNIVDHLSAKYKMAWCCLQCFVIGAYNSIVTMQLIEGRILFSFHNSNNLNISLITLFTCVGWFTVTCSWFGLNAIVKDNISCGTG